ncbi:dihydrofolate reductase [Flammula alnicola]|nr:dihydrofolate reductase [Flammula alnicola]
MSRLTIIVAATKVNGIGAKAVLPWRLSKELKYFARITTSAPEGRQNAVIMGRNTWESIPKKFRPLSKRKNIVISRNRNYDLFVNPYSKHLFRTHFFLSKKNASALALLEPPQADALNLNRGFIIGGATLYAESLALPLSSTEPCVDRILLTRILSPEFNECDVFMPEFLKQDSAKETRWIRSSHEALQQWVGFDVQEGEQEENGVKYEFQMWVREL